MADERTENRPDREEGKAAAGQSGGAEEATRGGDAFRRDLEELQKVEFALVELSLYLDTHPSDLEALRQFNRLAQQRARIAGEFEMKYGPLMQFGHSFSRYPWQWINTPWPWQV